MIEVQVLDGDLKKAIRDVRKWEKDKQDQVWNAMVDAANDTTKEAQDRVPVQTRRLRNSIMSVFNKSRQVTRSGTNVEYSPYVEFGTGTLVNVPAGLESYAMQFKGKGVKKVNLPARPFLFPAFFKNKKKLLDDIKKIFNSK
jgi:HK97 gp10 family phage protein